MPASVSRRTMVSLTWPRTQLSLSASLTQNFILKIDAESVNSFGIAYGSRHGLSEMTQGFSFAASARMAFTVSTSEPYSTPTVVVCRMTRTRTKRSGSP